MSIFKASYDSDADVLYLVVGLWAGKMAIKGVEDRMGIVWRYGSDGNVIGATVLDYHCRWHGKPFQLVSHLSERLDVSRQDIEYAIGRAGSSRSFHLSENWKIIPQSEHFDKR